MKIGAGVTSFSDLTYRPFSNHEIDAIYEIDYFGSTGNLALYHSFQPPLSAKILVYPIEINCRATQALVASSGQEQ